MQILLTDILKLTGFDPTLDTKLVRHQDKRFPMAELRKDGRLEMYQRYQAKPRFHRAQQIVSFYGLSENRAGFYGVYKVRGYQTRQEPAVAPCNWNSEFAKDAEIFYELEPDPRFKDFRDRLIIDWGRGALAWVQNLTDKPVLELLQPGRRLPPFVDYLEFSLTHDELKELFANKEAHRDWKTSLSAVAGIYLILAEATGDMYVGSAYGEAGIWGRWKNYAETGDGGNKQLAELIRRDSRYPQRFRFSLLQILPTTMADKEVIKRENIYKEKLGSRAVLGLNSN